MGMGDERCASCRTLKGSDDRRVEVGRGQTGVVIIPEGLGERLSSLSQMEGRGRGRFQCSTAWKERLLLARLYWARSGRP